MICTQVKAGFVGFGEVNTPREFIDGRCQTALQALQDRGIIIHSTAPVSDDPAGAEADRAKAELAKEDFDVLVLCVAGWIPSWAVLRTIDIFKHKPIILWGLSGWQEGSRFVTTADQAGSTGLRAPLQQMGFNCQYIINYMDEEPRYDEVADMIFAASAMKTLRNAKIGMCGYRDMNLYGTLYDGVAVKRQFGPEFEHFDLLEIKMLMDEVSQEEVKELSAKLKNDWHFVSDALPETIENSVRLALAFKAKIEDRCYSAFSYCDVDGVKKLLNFAPAGAMTLLHDLIKLPTVPENDSYGAVTQILVQALTGDIPAYLEFYEFSRQTALMGVPDYVPGNIVEGKITIMPNAFGSFGEGLLNISKLKDGPVNIVRLGCENGQFMLHLAKAEAKQPRTWEEAGWAPPAPQLPSLEMYFEKDVEEFLQNIQGQHYILAYGDITRKLQAFAKFNKIPLIEF